MAVGGRAERFVVIAHRGDQDAAPENTLDAFGAAVRSGFPHFEFDVQLSKDGIAVVIHDDLVDRTAAEGCSGLVGELTLEELAVVPLRNAGEYQPADWRIPTLRSLLEQFAGVAHLHLELKSTQADLARVVFEELGETGWLDAVEERGMVVAPGVTITSFILGQLQASLPLYGSKKRVRHMWLVSDATPEVVSTAVGNGLAGVSPTCAAGGRSLAVALEALTEQVERIRSEGLECRCWGVGGLGEVGEGTLRRAVAAGAQGTTVDWPVRARALLASARL